jgi:cytochrome c2
MSGRSKPVIRLLWMAALVVTPARADGDAARGEIHFADCVACHSTERNVNNVGPSLHGVFERKAGELPDFRYSPAIKRSGISWTAQTLCRDAGRGRPRRPDRISAESVEIVRAWSLA